MLGKNARKKDAPPSTHYIITYFDPFSQAFFGEIVNFLLISSHSARNALTKTKIMYIIIKYFLYSGDYMADIFDLFKQIAEKKESASAVGEPISYLVVGLGNPGDKYFHTRHNAGFLALDFISQKVNAKIDRSKFKALCGEAVVGGKRVLLMKPQTFMNNSGEAVAEAAKFYKIAPENIIVIFDDISLDVGRMRVRRDGSAGGHNGIKSIIACIGSEKFPRIKIGVGQKPHPDFDLADWVLSEFSKEDKEKLFNMFGYSYDGLLKLLENDIDGAMQLCNSAKG